MPIIMEKLYDVTAFEVKFSKEKKRQFVALHNNLQIDVTRGLFKY